MFRFLCLFLTVSCFADWDDNYDSDDDYCDFDSNFSQTVQISYGGMTVECPWGCGDLFEGDFHMHEIANTLGATIDEVFRGRNPLCLDWEALSCWVSSSDSPWSYDYLHEEGTCEVYDWQKTNGLYLSENPIETLSHEVHNLWYRLYMTFF